MKRRVLTGLFLMYLLLMFYLMFLQRIGHPAADYTAYLRNNCSFIPFRTITQYLRALKNRPELLRIVIVNLGGNVGMFLPLGLLLPALFRRQRRYGVFFLTVAGSIAIVEVLQLFTTLGTLDVDDLILNVIGASLAFPLGLKLYNPDKNPEA